MKTFDYTCRDKDGRLKKGTVQAEDRAGAVRALKAQGLSVTSLGEAARPSGDAGRAKVRAALLWVCPCAALALAAVWFSLGRARPAPSAGAADTAKAAAAAHTPKKPAPARGDAGPVPGGGGTDAQAGDAAPGPQGATDGGALPEAAGAPPAVEEAAPPRPPRAFTTATEQALGWIANAVPGGPPPILPMLPPRERADIAAILGRDIVLEDGDSEAATASKYNVAHAKQLLKQYLADGGTPEDFMKYYHASLVEAHREWREAQRGVADLQKAGDGEGAVRFYLEQSEVLRAKGIKPIILPPALAPLLEKMEKGEGL